MIAVLKADPFFKDKVIRSCTLLEHQGYCNEHYLLVADELKYIVRKIVRDGINRDFEWKVHNLAFEEAMTSEPLIFDKQNAFMLFSFLDGKHKKELAKADVKNLAHTLQTLHSIDIEATAITLDIQNQTKQTMEAFETIAKYPRQYVLCHNDLNPQNIMWSQAVKLIDWEYAGVNDKYFDLACVCVEFTLSDTMQILLLDVYFAGQKYALEKLEAYKVIYTALCKEWFI